MPLFNKALEFGTLKSMVFISKTLSLFDWNIIFWLLQSICGLYLFNQERPKIIRLDEDWMILNMMVLQYLWT